MIRDNSRNTHKRAFDLHFWRPTPPPNPGDRKASPSSTGPCCTPRERETIRAVCRATVRDTDCCWSAFCRHPIACGESQVLKAKWFEKCNFRNTRHRNELVLALDESFTKCDQDATTIVWRHNCICLAVSQPLYQSRSGSRDPYRWLLLLWLLATLVPWIRAGKIGYREAQTAPSLVRLRCCYSRPPLKGNTK